MATQKFSDLTTTTTPNSASVFAIAFNGSSLGVSLANIAANLPATTATSLATSGNATIGGDLTITGDDLFMGTNTSGAALIADGTNFNPVVISGDITISTSGVAAIGSGVIINADLNASAAIAFSKMANLTASRLLVSDGNGDVSVSAVTSTEAGYLDTVSSNIQTQLNAKAASNYVPASITVADESSDQSCFPLFVTAATGSLGAKTASGLTFNSSTDVLSGTFAGNISGNVTGNTSGTSGSTTGNAGTATLLATARNIGGVSFNGSVSINLPGVNTAGTQGTTGQSGTVLRTRGRDYKSDWGSASAPIIFVTKVISKTSAHPYTGVGSSNAYTIDGVEGAVLNFDGADTGKTYYYRFDQADSSNNGHPLRFYLNAAKSTAYTTNVTTNGTPGNAGAYTQIQVNEYTPSLLYYQCSSHAHMGNYIHHISSMFNSNGVLFKMPTSDGSAGQLMKTDGSGTLSFVAAGGTGPTISGVSPSTIPNAATNVTISGGGFVTIPGVEAQASTGAIITANTVSFTNSTTIVANFTLPVDGSYFLRVENNDGLATRSSSAILTASDAPTWNTASGSLGTFAARSAISVTVSASGDATLAYSKVSGSFPGGLSLNTSTGVISGTENAVSASTTFTAGLRVTDGQGQTADRSFSITIEVGMANSGQFN